MAEKHDAKHDAKAEKPQDKKQQEKISKRPQPAQTKALISPSGKEVRGIVRLAGKDLNGMLPIKRAITSVRGVGINLGEVVSNIAFEKLALNDQTLVGELTEEQLDKLEHLLMHMQEFGVPKRMLNRRKDLFTGNDVHFIGTDLTYTIKQDIDHEKDSLTWRGFRHIYGQKVRGQRTRSTGRTGMTVGVLRKAVLAKAGGAAAVTGAVAQAAGVAAVAATKAGAPAAKAPAAKAPAGKPAEKK